MKTLKNIPFGVLLRNDVTGLKSDGSDTNPLRPHAVADGGKLLAMANYAGRWEAPWWRELPNLWYPPGMGKMTEQCNVATWEKAEETQGDISSPSWSSSLKVEEELNPREGIFSRKASVSHLDCKRCVETLPCCQIDLPTSLGKCPRLLLVTSQPEWRCDKNNAREGSRKVWIDPTYIYCRKTRKEICGEQPMMFLKVAYCFDHWTCLLNAVLLNNNNNYTATYFLKHTRHALPILLIRKLRQSELSNSLTFAQ